VGLIEGKLMSKAQVPAALTLLIAVIGSSACGNERDGFPEAGDTLIVRLVHPERQASAVLELFDGARVAHPAAALSGWKRATRSPNQLGKPLEAVIAVFNPEMAREWRVMHDAELCLDLGIADEKPRWFAVVPRDDGALSAAITAMRLTDGCADAPVTYEGTEIAVERLGPAGAPLSARTGDTLILASTREELLRGLRRIGAVAATVAVGAAERESRHLSAVPHLGNHVDSGLVFDLDPGRMNAKAGTTMNRRAAALLQGLGCRCANGHLALNDDLLAFEVTTSLSRSEPSRPLPAATPVAVDPSWLTWVPARDVMAVVSLAFEPGAAFWDSAFAVADRVDRADPSRAGVAPLRARFNLLATAAGARPEVDLWPHLRGVSACLMGDPNQPGRPAGALVVLHTDGDAGAERLAIDVLPRLSALFTGTKPGGEPFRKARPGQVAADVPVGDVRRLATIGGQSLRVFRRDRDVVIAWGDAVLSASRDAAARPDRSVASVCTGWARAGKTPPQRVGAIWPARCWPAVRGLDTASATWRTLAHGPPIVWSGWTGPSEAHDSIHYSGLRRQVREFLDQLSLELPPLE
jgi:hypothetical protein